MHIKKHSPFPYTFVGEMFDGGDYNMADMWNYGNYTYSARDSYYMPGSAEIRADQVLKDLLKLWRGKSGMHHDHGGHGRR